MSTALVVFWSSLPVLLASAVVMALVYGDRLDDWWLVVSVAGCLAGIGLLFWGISLRQDADAADFLASCSDRGGRPFRTGSELRHSQVPTGATSGATVDVATRYYLYECRSGGSVVLTLDSPEVLPGAEEPRGSR